MRMLLAVGAAVMAGAGLVAQSPLAQLGLTETAARNFVLNEIKGPAQDRGADDWRRRHARLSQASARRARPARPRRSSLGRSRT